MVARLFLLRSLRCTSVVLLAVAAAACPSSVSKYYHNTPGTTTGLIYVSKPEVYTREHLVNERLDREAWLRKQLAEADEQTFGYQGLADTRSFQGWLSKTEGQVDPGALALYLAQEKQQLDAIKQNEESASLQHSIELAELQKRLNDLKSGIGPTPGTIPTAAPMPTPASPVSIPARPAGDQDKTYASILDLAKAVSPANTGATASPIDLFRDRLAYRDEIYAQRAENSLDDAHDLNGNTLYQLTFNTTIIPGNDTSHWAMIEVRIEPKVDDEAWDDLYLQWCNALEWYLTRLAWYRATVLQRPGGEAAISAVTLAGLLAFTNTDFVEPVRRAPPTPTPAPTPTAARPIKQFPRPDPAGEEEINLFLRLQAAVKEVAGQTGVSVERVWFSLCGKYTVQEFKELYALSEYVKDITFEDPTHLITVVARMENGKIVPPEPFEQRLRDQRQAYAYAVTPKELVQRISEVSSMREATQIALGLSVLLGGAKIGQFLEYAQANEAAFQAIKRAPLVVGYSRQGFDEGDASKEDVGNVFGWVLGPRFGLSDSGVGQLRHVVVQEPLTALISLPSWWRHAKLTVTTRWLDKTALAPDEKAENFGSEGNGKNSGSAPSYSIDLPGDVLQITETLASDVPRYPVPSALVDCVLTAGQAGEVLIQGTDLWRAPEVTLGAHKADSVTVLPDMHGIIARFESVPAPPEGVTSLPVRVWTSAGSALVGRATIVKSSASVATTIKAFAASVPRAIGGQPFTLKVTEGLIPAAYQTLKVALRAALAQSEFEWKDPSQVDPAKNAIVLDSFQVTPAPTDGTVLQVALQIRPKPGALVEEWLAAGPVVYYSSVAAASIGVGSQAFDKTQPKLDVTLTPPPAAATAYPGFDAEGVTVTAKGIKGDQDTGLTCVRSKRPNGRIVIQVSAPQNKPLGDVADRITLELANAGNPDIKLATTEIPPQK